MKALLTLAAIFMMSTNASAAALTQFEKDQTCAQVRSVIPTEAGPGISHKECLEKFTFDVLDKTGSITEVEMFGQTVEDVTTVCRVYILSNPIIEIAVPAPSCSLE